MADTNSFSFFATIDNADVHSAVRDLLDNYTGQFVTQDHQTDTTLTFEANEVSQGSVDECFEEVLDLIRDGDEEFECPVCKGERAVPGGAGAVDWRPCERCEEEGHITLPVPDFAFSVNDEPQDEFLGTLRIHVPGLPDFSSDCDGNGAVVVPGTKLLPLISEANNLEGLRADVATLTGQ